MDANPNPAEIPSEVQQLIDELGGAMPLISRFITMLKTDDDDDDDEPYRPPPGDQVFWEHVFEHMVSHGADPQVAGDKADEARDEWLKRFDPPPTLAEVTEHVRSVARPAPAPGDTH